MAKQQIQINLLVPQKATEVFNLVETGFKMFVREDLTEEGELEFFSAAQEMIFDRPNNHFILVAQKDKAITGMIDIRDNNHICLFFVGQVHQKSGIGSALFQAALKTCQSRGGVTSEITVNSSLFAVEAYQRLGFVPATREQMLNGIRFVPMVYTCK